MQAKEVIWSQRVPLSQSLAAFSAFRAAATASSSSSSKPVCVAILFSFSSAILRLISRWAEYEVCFDFSWFILAVNLSSCWGKKKKRRWWNVMWKLLIRMIFYLLRMTLLQWGVLSSSRTLPAPYTRAELPESPERWRAFGRRLAMSSSIFQEDEWTTNLSKGSTLKRQKKNYYGFLLSTSLMFSTILHIATFFLDEAKVFLDDFLINQKKDASWITLLKLKVNKSLSGRFYLDFIFNLWWN